VYREDLTQPALLWDQVANHGLCGKTIAVDGIGDVYTQNGCEDGHPPLPYVGHAEELAVLELRQALRELQPMENPVVGCSFPHRFTEFADGAEHHVARFCVSEMAGFDDLAGYSEPHAAAARRFLTLP